MNIKPSRREVFRGLLTLAAACAPAQTKRKPNLIIILADDLGYGDVGCYGSPDVATPNIDALARAGIRFTNGYVTNCVCSPTRAGIMTGRYQQRYGHEFNIGPARREIVEKLGLPVSEITLPQMLKQGGYATGMVGKWHLGAIPGMTPMDRGFDEFFGFLHGANSYITRKTNGGATIPDAGEGAVLSQILEKRVNPVFRGRDPFDEPDYLTDAFGREAVAFIDRHKKDPFFLYLPFNAVHEPLQTTAKYLDRVAHIKDPRHRTLASMTVAMDDNIGKVTAKLRESGLENDTLIFFLSDNGCPTYTHAGSNGPLSGSKCTLFEGGFRVPFVVKWTGKLPAGKVVHRMVSSLDIVPTFLTAAQVKPPADRELDGVDLVPYLTGGNAKSPHEILFWRNGPNSAVRRGNWKLMQIGISSRLYDLSKDIGEKTNLAANHPEVVRELRAAWIAWNAKMIAPKWPPRGSPKIPVHGETIEWSI